MQISGTDAAVRSMAATAPADAVTFAVMRTAMDAGASAAVALLQVLPDPHPAKGGHVDTYA